MDRKSSVRLLIADDHKLMADLCKSVLEREFEVLGVVTDGRALVKAAHSLKPDIVLLDITMPHLNGLDAGEQIKRSMPKVKLVFLTMNKDPEVAAEAFERGGSGYVLKQSAAEELLIALRKVREGESYLSPMIARETVNYLLSKPKGAREKKHLTPRQSEILQLLVEGKTLKEIANILDVKQGTVAFHKYRMMEALGVKTNAELLGYALRRKSITSEPFST